MKTILTLLIILPTVMWGQKKDTLKSKWSSATSRSVSTEKELQDAKEAWSKLTHTGRNSFTITPKQDTVKVLMLVCDTSDYSWGSGVIEFDSTGYISSAKEKSYTYKHSEVWWQFGYEVWGVKWVEEYAQEISTGNMSFSFMTIPAHYERERRISTLDENKKPLPKSIIVWMSKEIK